MKVCGKDLKITGKLLRIARLDGEGYDFLAQDPEQILDTLRRFKTRIDLFTFIQKVTETSPLYQYPMEWDNYAAVEISTFDHWWNQQIGFKARNKAKQAQKKGVVIREVPFSDELVQGIWELYNEHPVRQGRYFTHYGKDIKTVYSEEATFLERSKFVGAYIDNELIGFIKLVADETNTQAGLMNILSMIKHRDKAPTNALVAEAIKLCAERNIRYLVYSRYAYGSKEQSTISDFKERNGMHRIDVPRYYIPLTAVGRVALQLGLHKPLTGHVPASLLSKVREFRAAWYERKYRSAAERS